MKASDRPFWRWVAEHCEKMDLTEAKLAGQLKISPQTLASWKARNQFRRSLFGRLKEVLGAKMSLKQAVGTYKVRLILDRGPQSDGRRHPVETALRNANVAYRRVEKTFYRYADHALPLIRGLGENCFFAFSSCTTSPYEFEDIKPGNPLAEEMAQALFRGALLLYIRPTAKGMEYYEGTWGYGRVVRFEEAKNEVRAFRKFVEDKLVAGAPSLPRMAAEEAKAWLHARLSQCYIHRSPMWMPGVGLGMAGWTQARDIKARMTISLPGGLFGGVLVYPQYYPLEYRFGRVLRLVVRMACEELEAMRDRKPPPKRRRVYLPHLNGSDDPMLSSTHSFYQRFDRLLRTVSSHDAPPEALDESTIMDD